MAQRGARPSIPLRRRSVVDREGIVGRVCGAQASGAQRRVGANRAPLPPLASLPVRRIGDGLTTAYAPESDLDGREALCASQPRRWTLWASGSLAGARFRKVPD